MLNRRRTPLVLLLMALVALPLHAGTRQSGQHSAQDGKKRSKRPPLAVRVVSDSRVGVAVVVAADEPESGSTADAMSTYADAGIVIEGGVAVRPPEPEIENWLVGGPPQLESWLNGPVEEPAAEPAVAVGTSSTRLLGVQHYLESTQAANTGRPPSPAAGTAPVRVPVPPRATAAIIPNPASRSLPQIGEASPSSYPEPASGTYVLGPGDQIEVFVWRNPDLSRAVPVRPDGVISLPLAGELMASGKTVVQLAEEITAVLEGFVQRPNVTVTVTEVRSMVVYVTGQVAAAGPLTLTRPVNVVQAITMAGGAQEFANLNGVVVIREVNGRRVRIPYRYGDALKGKGDIGELVLQSGDVVYVP